MLEFEVMPGKQFVDGERVDNDKLNLLGRPVIEISGGVDATQVETGPWFVVGDNGSTVNNYIGQLQEIEQDSSGGALRDGTVVSFKIPITNTGASTFQLRSSTGIALTGAAPIK